MEQLIPKMFFNCNFVTLTLILTAYGLKDKKCLAKYLSKLFAFGIFH
jgi:hypothetical protein